MSGEPLILTPEMRVDDAVDSVPQRVDGRRPGLLRARDLARRMAGRDSDYADVLVLTPQMRTAGPAGVEDTVPAGNPPDVDGDPPGAPVATVSPAPVLAAPAAVPDAPAEDLPADAPAEDVYAGAPTEDAPADTVAEDTPAANLRAGVGDASPNGEPAGDGPDPDAAERALDARIARVVRAELAGAMGKRLSEGVTRLVHREVARALAERDRT